MPISFNFIDRFPLPSLRNYAIFSAALLAGVLYYAYDSVTHDESWQADFRNKALDNDLSDQTRAWLVDSKLGHVFYFMLTDQVCIWTVVNSACCALVLIGKLVQTVLFGRLRLTEQQQTRDRFWNFVFYKFVFIFGVMNVQLFDEVFLWSLWFAMCGFFYLLTSMAQDRLKFTFALPLQNRFASLRILVFLLVILFCDLGMLGVGVAVSFKYGLNYGGFLIAECTMLLLRVIHGLLRYGLHLYEFRRGSSWQERNRFTYYADLTFELCICCVDFLHHLHMLLWSHIFLSMASLVICMQLKHLYQEIDRRLKGHQKHQRIVRYINSKYPVVKLRDLNDASDNETCAICWDTMAAARQLTCGHLFHDWCLHGWLEQDTSCPTCRLVLSMAPPSENARNLAPADAQVEDQTAEQAGRRMNHFFRFDGRRYARWLPSFSVEVTHNLGPPLLARRILQRVDNSQVSRMLQQVQEMFPHLPNAIIEQDLLETNSVEQTVDNILSGRVAVEDALPNDRLVASETDTESEYESETSASDNDSSTPNEPANAGAVDADQSPSSSGSFIESLLASALVTGVTSSDDPTVPSTSVAAPANQDKEAMAKKTADGGEGLLAARKRQLIDTHRRRYVASERGADLRQMLMQSGRLSSADHESARTKTTRAPPTTNDVSMATPSTSAEQYQRHRHASDEHARRRMLYQAAQRHLPPASAD